MHRQQTDCLSVLGGRGIMGGGQGIGFRVSGKKEPSRMTIQETMQWLLNPLLFLIVSNIPLAIQSLSGSKIT